MGALWTTLLKATLQSELCSEGQSGGGNIPQGGALWAQWAGAIDVLMELKAPSHPPDAGACKDLGRDLLSLCSSLRSRFPCSCHSGLRRGFFQVFQPLRHLARIDFSLGNHQRNTFFHSLSSRTMIMTRMDTFPRKNLKRLLQVFHFPSVWWTKTGES